MDCNLCAWFGYLDGEPFIASIEKAIKAGDADFVEANMPRLERLIGRLQNRVAELVQLLYRTRKAKELHEPPADRRWA